MESNFITPMQLWNGLQGMNGIGRQEESSASSGFSDIFRNAVQDVIDTESNLTNQQYLLATGQTDDPHTVQIAASEAQLSTNFLVQLRNKALDSYNELMRMSL